MRESERNREGGRPWLSWIVLLVLLGVALALRWRYVREISLFVDEFVTAWAAKNVLVRGLPIFPSGNFYPHGVTITYLEVPFVAFGPFNEMLARIPGLLVGLAGLPVAYWVGRRLLSESAGLVAAAAMAVDPDFIVWGGRVRMYGLLVLLTLLVLYFFYQGLIHDRPRDRYLAMGLLVLAIFTHAEAIFLLPVLGLAALVVWPWRRLFRWSVVLPFGLAAVGVVTFYLLSKFGQPGHLETLQESRPYLDLSTNVLSGPLAFAPVFGRLHRLPFSLLALAGLYFVVRPRFDRRSPLTYLYVVLLAFLALLVFLAGETWQRERYLFMVLPLLFFLAGETLARTLRLRGWQPAALALIVALFVGLSGAPRAYVQEEGYDLAYRYLQSQWQPGDRLATLMPTGAMLYLDQCDDFVIQYGYEEFVKERPGDGVIADLWTATPLLTDTVAFTDLLASTPRLWFVTDGWRFQTRYETDFILTVLNHMTLDFDERGIMVFRSEGYEPLPAPAIERPRRAAFGDELALTGFGLSADNLAPGETLDVTLNWQALANARPAYTVFLHLVAPDGSGVAGVDESLLDGRYQPDLWPTDRALPDRHRLTLPPDLPPGQYRLDLGLYPSGQPSALLPVSGWDRLPLALLTVGDIAAPPPPTTSTTFTFGDATTDGQIRLLGYDSNLQSPISNLQLHWQAAAPTDRDYTVFVHLLGPDGQRVAQDDSPPGDLFFPTSTWLPGQIVLDDHSLALPDDAPPGDYTFLVGLYDQPTGERLPIYDADGNLLGDALPLATFTLGAGSP
jgi:4-amino-4-deoxy-L-arabinose transferase-like glycosyltransferase